MEEAPSQVIPEVVSFINRVPDTASIQRLTPDDIDALKATGPGAGISGVSGIRTRVLAGDLHAAWCIHDSTRSAGKHPH